MGSLSRLPIRCCKLSGSLSEAHPDQEGERFVLDAGGLCAGSVLESPGGSAPLKSALQDGPACQCCWSRAVTAQRFLKLTPPN